MKFPRNIGFYITYSFVTFMPCHKDKMKFQLSIFQFPMHLFLNMQCSDDEILKFVLFFTFQIFHDKKDDIIKEII